MNTVHNEKKISEKKIILLIKLIKNKQKKSNKI